MPKILHVSNDYAGSTVYMNLVRELDNLGVVQTIYSPIRSKSLVGKNLVDFKSRTSRVIYSSILNWHIDRVFYPYKILKIFRDIQKKIDFSQIDFIHAHTWYSDGGVAYLLSRKYNIPFIVTVRSTDLDTFYKKLAYLRPFGRKVLERAKRIILISASSRYKLFAIRALQEAPKQLGGKVQIIPNGVDPYWIEHCKIHNSNQPFKDGFINLIYVGTFIKRKKLLEIQQAVILLNENTDGEKLHLQIVGAGGDNEVSVLELVEQWPEYFTYQGKVQDKQKLAKLYRSADIFVMPSLHETFGLVYVEAMSQGLPILYTANEGIDGFYSDDIGEKVKQASVQEIAEKLSIMMNKLNSYKVPIIELKKNHDWSEIAKKYLSIYKMYI